MPRYEPVVCVELSIIMFDLQTKGEGSECGVLFKGKIRMTSRLYDIYVAIEMRCQLARYLPQACC